jgi:hypothetical protein
MSAFGTKRTFRDWVPMSAFGGKADIEAKLLTKDEARRIATKFSLRERGPEKRDER